MPADLLDRAVDQFSDWRWRLNNLYWITDKDGRKVRFEMNDAQAALFDSMHFMNSILKARQRGLTTFIQLFMLDACLFNSNIRAGTIAHTMKDAQAIFRDKVKYPYDNLPDQIKSARPIINDNATELMLANNSSIRVGTSLRSGTLQYLHISEYGKLCAKYPEKAREVRTGALNTVQAGQIVFIESTAEGQEGHFYEICESAKTLERTKAPLTPLDFKFHFYPWFDDPAYEIDPAGVVIERGYVEYFDKLESEKGIKLSPRKRAWYVKKADTQQDDMKREFPSTPEEAFEASVEGSYYGPQLAKAEFQGRIGSFPPLPGVPVNTHWDIGIGDETTIWFWQQLQGSIRVVAYYHNSGEFAPFYATKLQEYKARFGWTYGRHYFPHDAKVREWGTRGRIETLVGLGIAPLIIKDHTVDDGINAVRLTLPICSFDQAECADGLKALKSYRKVWDEKRGMYLSTPYHNWASHGADGFRGLAVTWSDLAELPDPEAERARKLAALIKPKTLDEMLAEHEAERDE